MAPSQDEGNLADAGMAPYAADLGQFVRRSEREEKSPAHDGTGLCFLEGLAD